MSKDNNNPFELYESVPGWEVASEEFQKEFLTIEFELEQVMQAAARRLSELKKKHREFGVNDSESWWLIRRATLQAARRPLAKHGFCADDDD